MKQIVLTIAIISSLISTPAQAFTQEELASHCGSLYQLGWDNMPAASKLVYIFKCKPNGWA